MRDISNILFLIFLITCCALASEETQESLDADTLQGFTSSAFMTTNDFESLKVTIEEPKASTLTFGKGSLKPKEDAQ